MLIPGRTKARAVAGYGPIRRLPVSSRQKLFWTFGNLLMFTGLYLLFYVGGLYVQIEYQRLAARGDNDLEVPDAIIAVPRPALQMVIGNIARPAAATQAPLVAPTAHVPQLNVANGQIASALPSEIQLAHVSRIERLVIPSIALDAKVIEVGWRTQDVDGQTIAVWDVAEYAVGQHRGSANPGEGGNVVLAGHVGGYGHVFRDLFYVHPGEQIMIYSGGQEFLYVVQDRLIVDEEKVTPEQRAENAKLIAPADHEVLTMITCWPPNGPDKFTQRVVVRAVPFTSNPESDTSANTVR
ncbi:MAG: sortase [Oscillochloris sp.]|nr:sortase [Oscillochloris sp.]